MIWPGTLWTDSGINEHGLALVQTAGPGMLGQGPGLAGCVFPRIVLERAATVSEVIAVLREVPSSGFGHVYVLADAAGDRAIVENVHDRAAVRSHGEDYAWAINGFVADELQNMIVEMPLAGHNTGLDSLRFAERSRSARAVTTGNRSAGASSEASWV